MRFLTIVFVAMIAAISVFHVSFESLLGISPYLVILALSLGALACLFAGLSRKTVTERDRSFSARVTQGGFLS
ncbi:MAG: hypothetical protein AAF401_11350 [Pseudomonadota bacterium]